MADKFHIDLIFPLKTRVKCYFCLLEHPIYLDLSVFAADHAQCIFLISSNYSVTSVLHVYLVEVVFSTPQQYIQIRSNEIVVWSVHEVKWVLFQLVFGPLKMLACPGPHLGSIPWVSALKECTVWHFTSKIIITEESVSKKFSKSLL